MNTHRSHVTVSGTFDHFHAGHRYLIDLACTHADHVSIGVTTDAMTTYKMLAKQIQPHDERVETLREYLLQQGYAAHTSIFPLSDAFGIARDDESLRGVYVSGDTASTAERINRHRVEHHLPKLDVIQVPFQVGEDNLPISSTRIRLGEIDREGRPFLAPFRQTPVFRATQAIRDELRVPFGDLLPDTRSFKTEYQRVVPPVLIAVGDIITSELEKVNITPNVSIIDHKSRREILHPVVSADDPTKPSRYQQQPRLVNQQGTIASEAAFRIAELISATVIEKQYVQLPIDGEEDLLALPAIQAAPLGSMVVYGQFDEGVVLVRVDEEQKHYCRMMLQRFER